MFTSNECLVLLFMVCFTILGNAVGVEHRFLGIQDTARVYSKRTLAATSAVLNGKPLYFRTIEIDEHSNRVFIGSRDNIYITDGVTLDILKTITWNSTVDYEKCVNTYSKLKYCANYIQFIKKYNNKLLVCGTNYFQPKYLLLNTDTYEVLAKKVRYDICSSPDPNYMMVGELTQYGELIAASYKSAAGRKPEFIGGIYVYENPLRIKLTSTTSKNSLLKPKFIKSFYIEQSVYVFFMETAVESNNMKRATVARMCQTDNGGSYFIAIEMWTTLRKSRLNCKYNEDQNIVFRHLVDVTYDETKQIFYAAYSLSKDVDIASTICVFTLKDIQASFNSNFLRFDEKSKNWIGTDNGNFLNGCMVNPAHLNGAPQRNRSTGKQPTNNLNIEALSKALYYTLMEENVESSNGIFQYTKVGTRFSKIAFERIETSFSNHTYPLLYIVTSNGNMLTVFQTSDHQNCIVEEIETGVKYPTLFELRKNKRILYLSSDETFVSMNLESCHIFKDRRSCVGYRSPKCGWSDTRRSCIAWFNATSNDGWKQNLTECSIPQNIYGHWSSWFPTRRKNSKYCLTRQRKCKSSDFVSCKRNETIEIINCTANSVIDLNAWMMHGPVKGNWSQWSNWSKCHNGLCGEGTISRSRKCDNPTPSNGGEFCLGNNFECKRCGDENSDCSKSWNTWARWGKCTSPGNLQKRSRRCRKEDNKCKGSPVEVRKCVRSFFIEWGVWSLCNCIQRIQHRYPSVISDCDNCTKLRIAEYRICAPMNCTRDESDDSSDVSTLKESFKTHHSGFTFTLQELVAVSVGIIIIAFLLCTFTILIIFKQEKINAKKN